MRFTFRRVAPLNRLDRPEPGPGLGRVRLARDHDPACGRQVTGDHGHAPAGDPADDHGWPERGAHPGSADEACARRVAGSCAQVLPLMTPGFWPQAGSRSGSLKRPAAAVPSNGQNRRPSFPRGKGFCGLAFRLAASRSVSFSSATFVRPGCWTNVHLDSIKAPQDQAHLLRKIQHKSGHSMTERA